MKHLIIRSRQKYIVLVLALVPLISFVSPAFGQASGNQIKLPAQQNPAGVTPKSRGIISPAQISKPTDLEEIKLDIPEQKQHPSYKSELAFRVDQIRIEGVTLFTQADMATVAAPYIGKEQTLTQLNSLVNAITDIYRQKGYLTTEAFIPPQDVVDGVLTIQVQEGFIGKISVEGNRFYRAKLVKRAVQLQPGDLLNFRTLENDLNRINRLNDGYKVKAALSAGDHPGQTNIKLRVAERQPFQISGTYDNQGRPFIGRYRGGVEFRNDSLTTLGDRLYGRWIGSEGTHVAMGSYALPLNRFGTELTASFAHSHVNVKLPVEEPPKIVGKAYSTSLGLSQPLDRERHWVADVGLSWQRISSYFDGDKTDFTDVRSIQAGLNFNRYDRWGRTFNRVQNTFAIGGVGGTARFWKVENYFNRLVVLPKNNLLILKAYAQVTPDGLPAGEQFQIGGQNSVRGYTEGLLIGDRGVNVGIEHRFPVPGLKLISPWLSQRVQAAWFYDYGRVWLDRSNDTYIKGRSDLRERTLLQSVGFGFRAQLTRFMQGFIDVGFGLGDRKNVEPERRQPTARVHFGVRTDLLPETYRMRSQKMNVYMPYVKRTSHR
jgi:hemolysin activation/secretion protein